ncbi:MAG: DUF2812 domain-containing protein [Roseiflexaceae bacterium]
MNTPHKIILLTRREIGSGLAFAEEYDLQRLSTWAAEGWRLTKIRGMWMELEHAPPEQVVFTIDYQNQPDIEYFEMCATAGWQHVTSIERQIHLFKSVPGTPAIFSPTDATTKYQRAARMFAKPALWSSVGLVVLLILMFSIVSPWLATQADTTLVLSVTIGLGLLITVVATISIFAGLPWIAYRLRLAGIDVRISRLGFGLLFAICGGILGYFIGSMIP